ncbi:hypothetical protein RCO27_12915 [Sphingosinicella sp. LHD-64]|uniref:hypothetical protein n=1 Tax=Sphingosinicella sp. LHD-64 TaxID=3072139 RepID=UPI00280EE140|nr:hypothetical protein [Sphingosinicella sp. LHD-64]MDQ8757125.1 hypothetical protein [Sphingosinicella sp. LHD-64]
MAALLLAFATPAFGQSSADPAFAYRNGFWRNLHHTLYAFASHDPAAGRVRRVRLSPADVAVRDALAQGEAATWSEAVRWYATNLSRRDLLFDDGMVAIGDAITAVGDGARPDSAGVPGDLRDILARAAPVYRARFWPAHRQANEAWRVAAEPLVAEHGSAVAARLSRLFGVAWPDGPIEVALDAYANSAGAYTSLEPTRITVATSDESYQGQAAFEMLMHEAGHALVGPLRERLAALVAAETARPGANAAALRRDLWHEILFYMVGQVAAETMPGYVPYADRNELWHLAWPGPDREALARHLDPYLAGRTSLDAALTALVRDLAATPARQ